MRYSDTTGSPRGWAALRALTMPRSSVERPRGWAGFLGVAFCRLLGCLPFERYPRRANTGKALRLVCEPIRRFVASAAGSMLAILRRIGLLGPREPCGDLGCEGCLGCRRRP